MPYYTVDPDTSVPSVVPLNDTVFPNATSIDIRTQIKLTVEKWKRFYSPLPYHQLLKQVTPQVDINTAVGVDGTTKFDPLYGEAVDAGSTTIVEPHLSGTKVAPNPELFASPINTNLQVVREAQERELKKWGFDKVRDMILRVPLGLLDELSVMAQPGDKVVWNGFPYRVLQIGFDTFWKNTNVPLYVALNVLDYRKGS